MTSLSEGRLDKSDSNDKKKTVIKLQWSLVGYGLKLISEKYYYIILYLYSLK